jgi:hypothetical protein
MDRHFSNFLVLDIFSFFVCFVVALYIKVIVMGLVVSVASRSENHIMLELEGLRLKQK